MKKLLLVLMVVALASFLMVGCLGEGTVVDDDDDDDGGGVVESACPTVSVTSEVTVEGKTYIQAGAQTVKVTFAVPTEPVSVYIGFGLRDKIDLGDLLGDLLGTEVVMTANADKTEYTGKFEFGEMPQGCSEAYIYVETCDTCAACKYPYTVDPDSPYAKLKVTVSGELEDCPCGGCAITISSVTEESTCDPDVVCCGDDCSGLASWSFRLFDEYPWNVCCDTGCEDPAFEDSGTDCPITFTTDCLAPGVYYAVLNLVDEVGNETNAAGAFDLLDTDDCILAFAPLVLPVECDYDDFCWGLDGDDNPIIIIDPSGTMDTDCGTCQD